MQKAAEGHPIGPDPSATGSSDDMARHVSVLLTFRGLAAFWLVYAAAFVLMLWLVSPGRTLQDALTAELLQRHLAGGYQLRNPPLYEWLLWALQELLGRGPLSYLVLRYSLIAAAGILFYAAVRRTVADAALAASFSLSLVLFFWFGWEAHHSISHTLALLVAGLALWIAALAYADKPTALRAGALGLVIGLGIMAKWSFLLLVLSLGVALAVVPSTRRIYAEPRSLLVLAAAALPVLPYDLWLAHHDTGLIAGRSVLPKAALTSKRIVDGATSFLTGLVLVFLPWILVVALLLRRCGRISSPEVRTEIATRLAVITALVMAALMAASFGAVTLRGMAPFGVSKFAIHYLFPVCLFAALGISGLAAARIDPTCFAPRLAVTSVIAAVAIFIVKLGSFYVVPPGLDATNLIPYARLAEELARRGLGQAQFVTHSPRDAGNLEIYMPDARALSLSARIEPPPPDPVRGRPCVLVWSLEPYAPPEPPPAVPRGVTRFLRLLKDKALNPTREEIAIDWQAPLFGARRRSLWYLLRGDDVEPTCRKLAATGVL
jgi:Dolichyl-phosphate-mannose-protein mannosyltransferase